MNISNKENTNNVINQTIIKITANRHQYNIHSKTTNNKINIIQIKIRITAQKEKKYKITDKRRTKQSR